MKSKFGDDLLFKDVDSIPLGTDFRRVIAEAVSRCDVLLAVIGDNWLNATDDAGNRRIDDPSDFVHIEIRAALERDIPVIPVLVERTNMPRDRDLPEPLRPLAFRNAISVRADPDFHNDMERLCRALSSVLKRAPKPGRRRAAVVVVASSETCSEIGVLGDIGMHVCHVPLRLGWLPTGLFAQLQKGYPERPNGKGGKAACDTGDNALLHTWTIIEGEQVSMRLEMKRMAPGATNTWFLEGLGTDGGGCASAPRNRRPSGFLSALT